MKSSKNDLLAHWAVAWLVLVSLSVYLYVALRFGHSLQDILPEEHRLVLRSIFYAVTIASFPLTNLIRHIQLRLNHTMPGNNPAKNRYLVTVIVSMGMMESVGIFGFVMFILGDDLNTLYIFVALSVLGVYLYRPKADEYNGILAALADRE